MLIAIVVGLALLGSAVVSLPELVVEVVRHTSDEVLFSVETAEPVVALTIDDGPSASTAEILEVLAEHGAHATFFLIGEHVRGQPELARRIVAEGHEAAHHMMSDARSVSLSPPEFEERFHEMDRIIEDLDGARLFRPGSGWYDQEMIREAALHGYRLVLGSIYPFDAHIPSAGIADWYIRRTVRPGSIIVLHDGPGRGARTAEVLRRILPDLRERGFRVVTVSELLETTEAAAR